MPTGICHLQGREDRIVQGQQEGEPWYDYAIKEGVTLWSW